MFQQFRSTYKWFWKRNFAKSTILFLQNAARRKPKSKFIDLQPPGSKKLPLPLFCIYVCKLKTVLSTKTIQNKHPFMKWSSVVHQDHLRYSDLEWKSALWTECTFKVGFRENIFSDLWWTEGAFKCISSLIEVKFVYHVKRVNLKTR